MSVLKITLPAGVTADQIKVDFVVDSEVVVDAAVISVPDNAVSTATADAVAAVTPDVAPETPPAV